MYYSGVSLLIFSLGILSSSAFSIAEENVKNLDEAPFVQGQVLVKIDPKQKIDALMSVERALGAKIRHSYSLVPGLRLYQFDPRHDVLQAVKSFKSNQAVIYAEPNYIYRIAKASNNLVNDPEFARLWGLENQGQTGGKADADINASLTWSLQTGSNDIAIGIIDTGMDYTHPDLVDNVWINPGEIKDNNKDDDQNGYVDDMHGINAIRNNGNPMDDNVHGTHVAGTIGAVGNNQLGVVGVAPVVKMIACKFLSSGGSGSTTDALKCLEYFAGLKSRATNPVNLVATNNSWGGGGSSLAMLDAIKAHERLGILFIAAAGNENSNNDIHDSYPANYDVANVISVAATDHNDRLATFSNYGKKKVHVAAPGVKILSTVLNHKYGELSGTSMATPHVTGLSAIIASHYKDLSYQGIKNLIMTGGQKIPSTLNTTVSGRRIRGADEFGIGSLTCENQVLVVRKEPSITSHRIALGRTLKLSATHINCANGSAGPLTVYQSEDGNNIVLEDNGENGDQLADDGIYSLDWTPASAGEYLLRFSDSDIVTVIVYEDSSFAPYVADDQVPYAYIAISGKRLHAGDDTMHQVVAPFPIHFGGDENGFIDLYVSSNGTISFTDRQQPGFLNRHLPTTVANMLIAPFWDDLTTIAGESDIYTEIVGSSPSRKFIIEWWKFKHFRAEGLGAFQVVFYENSSDFRFNYLDTSFLNPLYDHGASATVGLQLSQENALEYSFEQPKITSQKSILFSLN